MNHFSDRLQQVENHFLSDDHFLGYRKLIDCILDIGTVEFYQKAIDYTELYYQKDVNDEQRKSDAISRLAELKRQDPPKYKESEILISTDNVEKTYLRRNFELHPISFHISSREVVGLVGENGNGKTTLLRIIGGELKPSYGKIDYHFTNAPHFSYELKSQLAYIPQRIEILYGSLMDNLQFCVASQGIKGDENRLFSQVMLARFGLWPYRNLNWSELSSGYKMRFELVRTLLKNPQILLLDEPLANLDILAQQVILEDLKYLAQSYSRPIGIILSSQQLYEVEKVSDNVLFLEKGKLKSSDDQDGNENLFTVVEIETKNNKQELLISLEEIGLKELKFNGGSFIAYFTKEASFQSILYTLGKGDLTILSVRDISNSSRRFFVN